MTSLSNSNYSEISRLDYYSDSQVIRLNWNLWGGEGKGGEGREEVL